MTHKAVHSAVLEVGLHYQKGWSVDRIARFTFRLHRRRLRAQEEAARRRRAAGAARLRELPIAYQIGEAGDPGIGYGATVSAAEARTTNQRLFNRVRAQLSKRLSRSAGREGLDLRCSVCDKPATGWTYITRDHDGGRVTDGYATCAAHRSEESLEKVAETRAG